MRNRQIVLRRSLLPVALFWALVDKTLTEFAATSNPVSQTTALDVDIRRDLDAIAVSTTPLASSGSGESPAELSHAAGETVWHGHSPNQLTNDFSPTTSPLDGVDLVVTFPGSLDLLPFRQQVAFQESALRVLLERMAGLSPADVITTSLRSGSILFTATFDKSKLSVSAAESVADNVNLRPLVVSVNAVAYVSTELRIVVSTNTGQTPKTASASSASFITLLALVPIGGLTSMLLFVAAKRLIKKKKANTEERVTIVYAPRTTLPFEVAYPLSSEEPMPEVHVVQRERGHTKHLPSPRHVVVAEAARTQRTS